MDNTWENAPDASAKFGLIRQPKAGEQLVDGETLEKMGAKAIDQTEKAEG